MGHSELPTTLIALSIQPTQNIWPHATIENDKNCACYNQVIHSTKHKKKVLTYNSRFTQKGPAIKNQWKNMRSNSHFFPPNTQLIDSTYSIICYYVRNSIQHKSKNLNSPANRTLEKLLHNLLHSLGRDIVASLRDRIPLFPLQQ